MRRHRQTKKAVQKKAHKRDSFWITIRRMGQGILKVTIILAAVTFLSLFFLSGYHYLLKSPHLTLEHVQITGVDPHRQKELMALCGLNTEPNLLAINLKDLKKRIEAHPWIRSARLQRQLPHTLTIDIQRQAPVAILMSDGMYYINAWGEPFKKLSPSDDVDFPVITGISKDMASDGKGLETVVHVMNTLSSERGAWSVENLSEVNIRGDEDMSLYFGHLNAEVRCNGRNFSEKLAGLRRLTTHLKTSGKIDRVNRIDLNYTDGAVVSFESG
ncbi:MAG: FtsQ-type POTRA domain-containing protein [Deltaproteobacteria bacterium]|nr:FtsQ-type POTRA domain-containing protein [Deltaproteobacteria bacterium]